MSSKTFFHLQKKLKVSILRNVQKQSNRHNKIYNLIKSQKRNVDFKANMTYDVRFKHSRSLGLVELNVSAETVLSNKGSSLHFQIKFS